MLAGFGVEGDVTCTGIGKVGDDAVDRLDHKMHVNRRIHAVISQCRTHRRTDRQIGDIMIIHHIEMHHVRPRCQHPLDLLAQTGKVGG